jgi:hypothetical protein
VRFTQGVLHPVERGRPGFDAVSFGHHSPALSVGNPFAVNAKNIGHRDTEDPAQFKAQSHIPPIVPKIAVIQVQRGLRNTVVIVVQADDFVVAVTSCVLVHVGNENIEVLSKQC